MADHSSERRVQSVPGDPERLRILALTRLMDEEPEESLDRWVEVAAEALEAPIALITLVDQERQYAKALFGIAGELAAGHGVPLSHSLCKHAIAGGTLVVEDAREDPVLRENGAVRELGIVAYAGVPLTIAGQPVGALCVMDRKARTWTPAQLRLLRMLTDGVAYEIELRVASAELARGVALTQAHNRIHRLIAADEPLPRVLGAIVESIETHDPELYGSIMLLDQASGTLHHGAASRLPDAYLRTIEGIPAGPRVGSCGASAYSGQEAISEDLRTDARWDDYRRLTEPFGLRHCWSFPVTAGDGSVLGTFGVYGHRPRSPSPDDRRFLRDAARLAGIAIERRRTQDRLVFEATHDSLTGLANRSTAFEHLTQVFSRHATGPETVSVLFVDLDRLKVINDSLGHETGDRVIGEAAHRLEGCVGPDVLVARIGGEEFLIVAVCDHEHAAAIAHRALSALRAPLDGGPDGHDLTITASIGIAVIGEETADAHQAIRRADTAMFAAKARGGDAFAWSDDGDLPAASRRLRIEAALRQALERNEIGLVFQPLQRMADGRTGAVEALVRWSHPELGPVAPGEFIPIAEQTGLIHDLGAAVLRGACASFPELVAQYGPDLRLGVNVSAQQMRDPQLPGFVADTLGSYGVPAERLNVEITETALLSPDPVTAATVRALHLMGVQIVLDDFGTGYSSPTILKRHPISAIKIDGSFIDGIPDDRNDLAIVTALIGMAKGLGLQIVGECIETQGQYDTLRQLGCDAAQGFLIGRPAAAVPLRASRLV